MFLYSTPLGHQLLALMGGAAVACVVSKRAIRKSPVPPKQLTDLLTHFNFWHLSDCVHRREKRGGGAATGTQFVLVRRWQAPHSIRLTIRNPTPILPKEFPTLSKFTTHVCIHVNPILYLTIVVACVATGRTLVGAGASPSDCQIGMVPGCFKFYWSLQVTEDGREMLRRIPM